MSDYETRLRERQRTLACFERVDTFISRVVWSTLGLVSGRCAGQDPWWVLWGGIVFGLVFYEGCAWVGRNVRVVRRNPEQM